MTVADIKQLNYLMGPVKNLMNLGLMNRKIYIEPHLRLALELEQLMVITDLTIWWNGSFRWPKGFN